MSTGTKSLLQRLALFIAYALVLVILQVFGGYALIFAAPLSLRRRGLRAHAGSRACSLVICTRGPRIKER